MCRWAGNCEGSRSVCWDYGKGKRGWMELPRSGTPVSYTHLDVYKRQQWWNMSNCPIIKFRGKYLFTFFIKFLQPDFNQMPSMLFHYHANQFPDMLSPNSWNTCFNRFPITNVCSFFASTSIIVYNLIAIFPSLHTSFYNFNAFFDTPLKFMYS